ncbi:MAG TPA: hypothetical protein EYP90_09275, partial [Chromatiaceae bacterium]|nr:hypothetical protein [Chromatiaceae bacterium]
MTLEQLLQHVAAYQDHPSRTTALEQQIRIGTGFHHKWYRSQREHWLGWLIAKQCEARRDGRREEDCLARTVWNRLKCSPMMFWLADAAGVDAKILTRAEQAAEAA